MNRKKYSSIRGNGRNMYGNIKEKTLDTSLAIYYCGHEICKKNHDYGPAIRGQYLLHFVIAGKGSYRVKNHTYEVAEGQVFLIKPSEITYYKADDTNPWEYMWIAFDGIVGREIVRKIGLEDNYVTSVLAPKEFEEYLRKIIVEIETVNHSEFMLLSYFYGAMSQLVACSKDLTFTETYLSAAITYIENHYSYNIKIADIARYVGIDRTYLYKIFMNELQISPKKYLINTRIVAAKNMLQTKKYTLNEIALSCGFSDTTSFTAHFKNIVGISPKKYNEKKQEVTMV